MFRLFMLCGVLLAAFPAKAEIVTRCGASTGFAYRLSSDLIPKEQQGWQEEKITEGEMLLQVTAKNGKLEYDLITKDAVAMYSQKEDGFIVLGFPNEGNILVVAVNPRTAVLQHYVFELDDRGNGKVVWGTSRAGMPIPKGSLMTASCAAP